MGGLWHCFSHIRNNKSNLVGLPSMPSPPRHLHVILPLGICWVEATQPKISRFAVLERSKSSRIHQRDSFLKDLRSCWFLCIHPWTWTYKIVLNHHLKLIMDICSCLLVNYNGGTQAIKMLPMLARKKNRNCRSTEKGLEAAWKPTVYFSPTRKGCLLGWFAIWSGGNSRVIMQNLSETHINVAIAHTGILHAGILHIQFHIWWFPYGFP